jgi:nitrogen fixation negative regulator NifL
MAADSRSLNPRGDLKRRAEDALRLLQQKPDDLSSVDVGALIHELSVHQMELEMQGDELRESIENMEGARKLYFQYFQNAPIPILRFTPAGRLAEANRAGLQMLSLHAGAGNAVPPESFERMVSRSQWKMFEAYLREALAGEAPVSCRLSLHLANASPRHFLVTLRGVLDGENHIVIGFFHDETLNREIADENERLSLLVKHTSDAVVFTDAGARIEWVNDSFTDLTGYTSAEVMGLKPSFMQGPDTDPATVLRLHDAVAAGAHIVEQILNYGKDGRPYWISLEIIPRRDERGRLLGFMSMARDITRRVRREIELQNFRTAVEQSDSSIVITDESGVIEYVNPAFCRETGYESREVIGQNPRVLKSGEMPESIYQEMWATLTAGKIWRGELCNRRRDGSLYWESANISPVMDEDGKVSRFIAVKENIDERRALLRELHEQKRLLDDAGQVAGIGGWDLDLRTMVPRWTSQTYRIHELPTDYVPSLEKSLGFFPPEARSQLEQAVQAACDESKPYRLELPFITARGRRIWVRTIGKVEFDGDTPVRLVGTFQDITERRRTAEEIERTHRQLVIESERAEAANRAKSEFLANMSHEIRTPLNAIIGMSELLEEDPTSPQAAEFLETIRTSGNALLSIVNDILDFSKIEAGQMELEVEPFLLRECLRAAMTSVSAQAAAKGLILLSSIGDEVPETVFGDSLKLRQVLLNLLSNAVKFTNEGEVRMEVTSRGSKLRFEISDTGIGIPPDRLGELFQSFSQVDSWPSRRHGGTGLGLAISQRLVHLMNGEIEVESIPGRGTRFHFSLELPSAPATRVGPGPALPERSAAGPATEGKEPTSGAPSSDGTLRIMVAEDNPVNQRLMKMMLRSLGYEATLADNGHDVLRKLESQPVDLIFMDIQMPEMDGLETAEHIRRRYPEGDGPRIVALTANVQESDREACRRVGMEGFLAKPIRKQQLADVIQAHAMRAQPGGGI